MTESIAKKNINIDFIVVFLVVKEYLFFNWLLYKGILRDKKYLLKKAKQNPGSLLIYMLYKV